MQNSFRPGQRWISESEPELGLGSVLRVTTRTVTIVFGASGETREYARDNAPLRRVRFRAGDAIKSDDGTPLVVQTVVEHDGLLFYGTDGKELCESGLSALISFNKPEERLLAGQIDSPELFDLRLTALNQQHRRRKSKVRGFVGGRIDLIPHQLYIASEVAGRLVPRVLLADEVGLGKTIEACLILHQLILTGRAQRVLILVPESLVHQWFVELLRRFNLWFHIFDEERCDAIETGSTEANPFLDDQLVLSSIGFFVGNEHRLQQALAAGWDMLVVDEAHHLGWSPEGASREYEVVEALGRQTPGLLLLTATPEQLGMTSHFARLRLLDPDRFYDREEFIEEAEHYRDVARLAEKLLVGSEFSIGDVEMLARILAENKESVALKLAKTAQGDSSVRDELMGALLDRHGTGRVMFRNTRTTIAGFPKRVARMHRLIAEARDEERFDALAEEFSADTTVEAAATFQPDFSSDPRIDWLADLLRSLGEEKVLLICRTQIKVAAIDTALRQRLNVKMAVFHEGLSLVQRDRNAAWFADEHGARLLICSEIGSEGRNFQFAHHLVLFDLPLDPELLEQRIGRLDRIGQKAEIQVHVPFVAGSSQEVLARWYQESLDSFEKNQHGARELREQFGARIRDLAQDFHETEEISRVELDRLIEETKAARKDLTTRLEQGRDRLLELNSFRPDVASAVVDEIRRQDQDASLDEFMISVLDHHSIHVEELGPRTYRVGSAGVFADVFPGLPAEGFSVTCDRPRALSREEIQFLTWDHPLVTGALDLWLGSEKGNSSFAHWIDPKIAGLYLEAVYLLECIAPPHLHVDRFLPPTPVRVLVDHKGADVGNAVAPEVLARQVKKGDPYALLDRTEMREKLLPAMLEKARVFAEAQVPRMVAHARSEMNAQLAREIARLHELQKVNRSVRAEEIELLEQQQSALNQLLKEARLR
ncbi:MAG TPA: RNA polymerase-associated protein RapA, partial [Candidatus Limnocylindria bacterium]|nr:RNA polymerase-associated protein RapA [Candidatus Limnocylindria bacterium]